MHDVTSLMSIKVNIDIEHIFRYPNILQKIKFEFTQGSNLFQICQRYREDFRWDVGFQMRQIFRLVSIIHDHFIQRFIRNVWLEKGQDV